MPEVITQNYSFMTEISALVRSTNHFVTDSNANITICANSAYTLYVKELVKESNTYKTSFNQQCEFKSDGSYVIILTYQTCVGLYDTGDADKYMFFVDGLKFITRQYLSCYFTACKRIKSICSFASCGWFNDRFWFFEVNNGEIINAFYYYEKNEMDIENSLVYDLINKNLIRHGDWRKQYPYLKP